MYAVVNGEGQLVVAAGSQAEAAREASRAGYTELIADQTLTNEEVKQPRELEANADPVEKAHQGLDGIVIDFDRCMSLSLAQAAEKLQPLVPQHRGKPVQKYRRPLLVHPGHDLPEPAPP